NQWLALLVGEHKVVNRPGQGHVRRYSTTRARCASRAETAAGVSGMGRRALLHLGGGEVAPAARDGRKVPGNLQPSPLQVHVLPPRTQRFADPQASGQHDGVKLFELMPTRDT